MWLSYFFIMKLRYKANIPRYKVGIFGGRLAAFFSGINSNSSGFKGALGRVPPPLDTEKCIRIYKDLNV